MNANVPKQASARLFRFADAEYDEGRGELIVAGRRCELEAKPLAVLLALLLHPGTAMSKQALIEAVWSNAAHTSPSSLATAISKLRAALGEHNRHVIEVVHASGYRLAVPVDVQAGRATPHFAFTLAAGDEIHLRPGWQLLRPLGATPQAIVWLAACPATQATRVFRFADSKAGLAGLKQIVRVSRDLITALGEREDLVPILGWNFDHAPYFLETAYAGPNLLQWAEAPGGAGDLPVDRRVAIAARLAHTIAAAHGVGITHGDLAPSKILVEPVSEGGVRFRIIGFVAGRAASAGGAAPAEPAEPASYDGAVGELPYMSPERLGGAAPNPAADIYALGVLLYQLASGDLRRPLTVGWETDVPDPLLRQDIAAAVSGDLASRLASAAFLAERLETLAVRRAALEQDLRARARANALQKRVEREQLRRPWLVGTFASLVIGIVSSTIFAVAAFEDRDFANRRSRELQAVNGFLTQDLLGRGDPAMSGTTDETLMEAAKAAEGSIDRRLASEPEVAGTIYLSLAKVYASRSSYDNARRAFDRAEQSFVSEGAPGQPSAIIAQLLRAGMEITSAQPGALTAAQAIISTVGPKVATMADRRQEAEVELATDSGMIGMWGGDVIAAQKAFRNAADGAEKLPDIYDATKQLSLRRQEAFTYARLGDWSIAEPMLLQILTKERVANGARHPDTLHVELNLAEIRLARGEAQAALDDADKILPNITAVLGQRHFLTLQALTLRAESLASLQRYTEAAAAWLFLSRIATVALGSHSIDVLEPQSAAAKQLCRAGQLDAGLNTGAEALAEAQAAFGKASPLTQEISGNVAFCMILSGHAAQANALLTRIDPKAVSGLIMDPGYYAKVDVMKVAVARQQGDLQFGNDILKRAALVFSAPGADGFMRDWVKKLAFQTMPRQ